MEQYISKAAVVAKINKLKVHSEEAVQEFGREGYMDNVLFEQSKIRICEKLLSFLDTLEVIDPYEQLIQYPSREDAIQAHAEDYSFNIESELFNQLTKEQQKLWRKEIEQACVSGGYSGLNLAKDPRYKENLEVKEVDLEKEYKDFIKCDNGRSMFETAKHFFELGLSVNNPITAADRGTVEEIIINLKRVEQDYRIDLTKEIGWVRNKVKKGE